MIQLGGQVKHRIGAGRFQLKLFGIVVWVFFIGNFARAIHRDPYVRGNGTRERLGVNDAAVTCEGRLPSDAQKQKSLHRSTTPAAIRCDVAWQIATASASAASSESISPRSPVIERTINCTCCFSARPYPTTL